LSKISEAREGYTPRTARVTVCLDNAVSDERDALMGRIREVGAEISKAEKSNRADERLTRKTKADKLRDDLKQLREDLAALEDREREHMHTLQFTKLKGLQWADLTAIFPPREKVPFDMQLGYNHHAAAIAAAKTNAVELVSGKPTTLDDDDWSTLLDLGSGWDVENIVQTVLDLNVLHGSRAVARLKKD